MQDTVQYVDSKVNEVIEVTDSNTTGRVYLWDFLDKAKLGVAKIKFVPQSQSTEVADIYMGTSQVSGLPIYAGQTLTVNIGLADSTNGLATFSGIRSRAANTTAGRKQLAVIYSLSSGAYVGHNTFYGVTATMSASTDLVPTVATVKTYVDTANTIVVASDTSVESLAVDAETTMQTLTIPVAGNYKITAQVCGYSSSSSTYAATIKIKNGTTEALAYSWAQPAANNITWVSGSVSKVITCAANDTITNTLTVSGHSLGHIQTNACVLIAEKVG